MLHPRPFARLVPFAPLLLVLGACSAAAGAGGGGHGGHAEGGTAVGDGGASVDGGGSGDAGTRGDGLVADGGPATRDGATDGALGGPDAGLGTDDGGATGCVGIETCGDGLDNDCNGLVDDGCSCSVGDTQRCYDGNPAQAGVGVCAWGMQSCTSMGGEFGEWGACAGLGAPEPVVCGGGMDYRCDGMIDEGCGCTPGDTRACYTGPAGTEGVGLCQDGTETCVASGSTADWGPCMGDVTPHPELCDGMDHDCDGTADTGCTCVVGTSRSCYDGPSGTDGIGICHDGAQSCVAGPGGTGSMWGSCMGEVLPEPDTCDGVDHMCTGMPGAGCACTVGDSRACYTGPVATRSVGACRDGTQSCVSTGSGAAWSSSCGGEVTPVAEICGNGIDDDCDGVVDNGCGPAIVCPGDLTVPAGQPVTLSVSGSGLHSFSWLILSAPTGGASTATWGPLPLPISATEIFTPYIVGTYTIQVSAVDASGSIVTCTFTVTALPHGLRVQLTWDGAGDVDLHLHDGTTSSPWFTSHDCYYSDLTPAWGASLDFDNTTSDGPENISLNTPAIGMTYTVAVHNYANAAGRTATVKVFCGSTSSTMPTQTFTSHVLSGTGAGNCTSNDFWRVATVTFTSATACTITPIDTYTPSTNACTSY